MKCTPVATGSSAVYTFLAPAVVHSLRGNTLSQGLFYSKMKILSVFAIMLFQTHAFISVVGTHGMELFLSKNIINALLK